MAFKASFTPVIADQPDKTAQITFGEIVGYRVSAQFTPGAGFQDEFFITLVERVEAVTELKQIKMMDNATDFRGSLELVDDNRSYTFNKLDLLSVLPMVDRKQRCRLLEFRYAKTVTNQGIGEIGDFKGTTEVKQGDLKEDYRFSISQTSPGDAKAVEAKLELLGFACRQAAAESPVYRLHSICSDKHSWLKMLLTETRGGSQLSPSFMVNFAQGALNVNKDTTAKVCVDESWGISRAWSLPSLLEISGASRKYPRHDEQDPTPEQLLAANGQVGSDTVGTLTIVFNVKNYHNLPIK